MTYYTVFNPDGDAQSENVVFSYPSKYEAKMNLPSGWYMIRGRYVRNAYGFTADRMEQESILRFIKRVINGEVGATHIPYELVGNEYRPNHSDDFDDEFDDDMIKMVKVKKTDKSRYSLTLHP